MSNTDHVLASVAARRYGVISTAVARRHGISLRTLSDQVRRGRLRRLYRSVYLVGVGPFSEHTRWQAALDACGEESALTLWSAARAWNISDTVERVIDVIAPTCRRHRHDIRLHRSRTFTQDDVTIVDGLRVLRVERLIIELADVSTVGRLCRLLDKARFRDVLDLELLLQLMQDHRRRRGYARLSRAVAMLMDGSTGTRSRFEESVIDRVLDIPGLDRFVCRRIDEAGLSLEPDVHFPSLGLMIEVDDPTHDQPVKRRSDQSNDRRLAGVGITVVRIHWTDVDGGVAAANKQIIRRSLAQGASVPAKLLRRWLPDEACDVPASPRSGM